MWTLPNILTFSRIISIPFFVAFFYLPVPHSNVIVACLFTLAALTDWVDGYVARHRQQTTRFGAFLDPVADKLMVTVALILILGTKDVAYLAVPIAIIICREMAVSALREWMAEIGKQASMAVIQVAKLKTGVQMFSIILLLLYQPVDVFSWLQFFGSLLIVVAAILTLWSMLMYLKVAWPDLTNSVKQE